jgi:hypothetical protein
MLMIPDYKRNANRIATTKNTNTTNVGEVAGKRNPHTLLVGL